MFSVANKNVLITGGSRGIGLMIADGFLSAGANVLITSRDENACREAVDSLLKKYEQQEQQTKQNLGNVHYVSSNVSSREGCAELAKYTSTLFNGHLDVLVNNAGTSWGEDPYDNKRSGGKGNWGWDKVMDLNVKGLFYLSRECVPLLQRRQDPSSNNNESSSSSSGTNTNTNTTTTNPPAQDPGRIINIGSIAGIFPQEAPTHAYDTSKAAVHHLTRKMAADLACKGITVNAIAPGYVPSRMSQGLSMYVEDGHERISSSIPLGRMGDDIDMAGAAIYLSSRASSWCTGMIMNVDGGACTLQMPLSSL